MFFVVKVFKEFNHEKHENHTKITRKKYWSKYIWGLPYKRNEIAGQARNDGKGDSVCEQNT